MTRQRVLVVILGVLVSLAIFVLFNVIGTVFFAVTVAYLLAPVYERLVDGRIGPWWASALTTTLAFVAVVLIFLPFGVVVYIRRTDIISALRGLPDTFVFEVGPYAYTVNAGDVIDMATSLLSRLLVSLLTQVPILAVKLTLFVIVVFALLIRRGEARRAITGPIPDEYHDIVDSFNERMRSTLFAIYVLQAATAFGTFVIAMVIFFALGYKFFFSLALVAALLQFLPVVGPSILIILMSLYELSVDDPTGALVIAVLGLVFIAWLPDAVIRPRLAQQTAHLPGSLYFIGFTGGLLTLGPIGVVAGPIVVALIAEAISLLTEENESSRVSPGS